MSAAEENLLPEVSLIQGRIEEVSLGEPTVHGQMAIFPLLDKEESALDYLTLDESIANGYAHVTEVDERDGFKYFLEDGSWCLIRFSGTEPLMRLYAEANTHDQVKLLIEDCRLILGI